MVGHPCWSFFTSDELDVNVSHKLGWITVAVTIVVLNDAEFETKNIVHNIFLTFGEYIIAQN
jgi:hypothetical protein